LDLDDFKSVNDRYGHAIGDELLVKIASRLSHSIREPDTVCRMGGDEFVLLLQQFVEKEDIVKVGGRIAAALSQPFDLCGQQITMTCSIGAAFFPDDGEEVETLLQSADAAMYASKMQGKNHFRFYSESD
jgi:diguanylate cyclase